MITHIIIVGLPYYDYVIIYPQTLFQSFWDSVVKLLMRLFQHGASLMRSQHTLGCASGQFRAQSLAG